MVSSSLLRHRYCKLLWASSLVAQQLITMKFRALRCDYHAEAILSLWDEREKRQYSPIILSSKIEDNENERLSGETGIASSCCDTPKPQDGEGGDASLSCTSSHCDYVDGNKQMEREFAKVSLESCAALR